MGLGMLICSSYASDVLCLRVRHFNGHASLMESLGSFMLSRIRPNFLTCDVQRGTPEGRGSHRVCLASATLVNHQELEDPWYLLCF